MSTALVTYRAKAPCRAGGFFRRAGDEFEMPVLERIPAHLEVVGAVQAAAADKVRAPAKRGGAGHGRPAPVHKDAQVNRGDIGAGAVTAAQEVTSWEMVTK